VKIFPNGGESALRMKETANAITHVEIKDFLVFKGKFSADFCPGVNVLIGGNGSGKTTLLKCLRDVTNPRLAEKEMAPERKWGSVKICGKISGSVFIPEKDILEHAKGLLSFIEKKESGFDPIYRDILISAQDVPTKKQSDIQKSIGEKIVKIIGGHIEWVPDEGTYYMIKADGHRIPFSNEASGYKKLGYLGLAVTTGQLEPGSILFWDEPENSLNPELVPELVDILLELQRGSVQVFVATHSYDIARWFELSKRKDNSLRYFNLRKTENGIVADVADEYTALDNSVLREAGDKLLKAVVKNSMGVTE
jgi:predicted ATPase